MDHPLLDQHQKQLRQRVVDLLRDSYNSPRSSRIVFVCGGTKKTNMRAKFSAFCKGNSFHYEIFFPEYAMETIKTSAQYDPFDLADFETIVSKLSLAIVIFPEGPGSFAETGYFSAIDSISERCILVLDSLYQNSDSFISLGPAKKIAQKSAFHPVIYISYKQPDFSVITDRMRRITPKHKKQLVLTEIDKLDTFEMTCLIHEIVNILGFATVDDINFVLKSIFRIGYAPKDTYKLAAILVGANYLKEVGEYGHMTVNREKPSFLEIRDGRKTTESELRLELANLYQDCDEEFRGLFELYSNAD